MICMQAMAGNQDGSNGRRPHTHGTTVSWGAWPGSPCTSFPPLQGDDVTIYMPMIPELPATMVSDGRRLDAADPELAGPSSCVLPGRKYRLHALTPPPA